MSNDETDALVLSIVAGFQPIRNGAIRSHEAIARAGFVQDDWGYVPEVDRALQRLRKAQKIAPGPKGWTLGDARTCTRCKGSGKEPARR